MCYKRFLSTFIVGKYAAALDVIFVTYQSVTHVYLDICQQMMTVHK
jgi:hypothetical protein